VSASGRVSRVNVDAAVFKNLPRKQEPRNHGVALKRRLTLTDLQRMNARGNAEKMITGIVDKLFVDLVTKLAPRLVNAGPHVVDLRVEHGFDPYSSAYQLSVSTPLIATKTYGAQVSGVELRDSIFDRSSVRAGAASPTAKPSLWRRFAAWVDEGVPYDGPRGWIDT